VRLVLYDHGARQKRLALGDIQNAQAARSLLSMARLSSAKSRAFSASWSLIRIAQISLSFSGAFWPTSLPLFQGTDDLEISI